MTAAPARRASAASSAWAPWWRMPRPARISGRSALASQRHELVELGARGESDRRPARQVAGRRLHDRAGHAHRDVQMDGSGHAAGGERNRAVDERARAALPERDAALGDRREQRALVEDLMRVGRRGARVEGRGEDDHGRAVEIGVGDGRHQVGDARPDRADQDARRPRELRHRVGHEAARRLVLDQVKRDAGARERVHDRQHLAAGDAEGVPGPGLADALRDVVGDGRHEARLLESKKWAVSAATIPRHHAHASAGRLNACRGPVHTPPSPHQGGLT